MATIYFTNTEDNGDGSLRAALASASAGDTVAPDPSAIWNDGDIVITLNSTLTFPSVIIEGTADRRIVFDGFGQVRFANQTASASPTFRYVDFKNGIQTGSTSPFYVTALSASDSIVFEKCRFYDNVGYYCGFFHAATVGFKGTATFTSCVSYGNTATRGATYPSTIFAASAITGTINVSGCTFIGDMASAIVTNGGTFNASDSLYDGLSGFDPATAGFVDVTNDDYRLTSSSSYLTGGATTGTDFLGHARTGSVGAFDGSWFVVSASGTATVSSNTEVDYLDIGASATVTFSGTDRILAGTKGATIGAATFQAASDSTGYLATPSGTSTSAATFTGVKAATFGAGASSLSSTTTGANAATLTWNQTNSGVPVLLELQDGSDWTTVSTSATSPASVTATPIAGKTYRIFDGENFATVTVTAQGFVFARQYQVISGSIGSFSATEEEWETITQLVGVNDSMNEEVRRGQAVTLLARIYDAFDNDSPLLNNGTNISSVYYTCEKTGKGLYQKTYMPVVGHNNVSAGADCVLSSLATDDAWEADSTGYNFVLTPDIRQNTLFDDEGQYRFKVTVNLASGNPIVFYHSVTVAK